ncbi:MAG: hypothetical protein K9K67_05230 [Bacteriovoracaceae bacterium]|nr:hypothetical protein [Bacteriovoracaceae bacterium]
MKPRTLFLISALGLISSYLIYNNRLNQKSEIISKTPSNTKIDSDSLEVIKKPTKKSFVTEKKILKKSRAKDSQSTLPHQLPITDPRHLALADSQGNIYPDNLTVDEDYVVAYGDIIVGESRYIQDYESGEKILKVSKPKLWPSRRIPYRIGEDITEAQKKAIINIATKLESEVQLKLTPYNPYEDKAYVFFKKGSQHCYAQVGYTGDINEVALNEGCGQGEIFHEVFHVLGFFHEQNRFDRDDYIRILWENIEEKHYSQFEKFPEESFPENFLNMAPFSFETIMLYRPTAFSQSSDYSIVTIDGEPYSVASEPTKNDYERILFLYKDVSP